ncbi:hypothetical protein OROHE_022869 [Orobanche hederae]
MYETYWKKLGDQRSNIVIIPGHQSLSYFSDKNHLCWYLEPKLEEEIKSLHNLVGNAVVENHHIVIGTGSSQLIQAAFYALSHCPNEQPEPVNVVSAAPYYSGYQDLADFLRSGLFKWAGDANSFHDENRSYIEVVKSPNNPDGVIRKAVVNGAKGMAIHDLAYYWPQYTAVTSPADHDVMLFTLSKSTGHAGSRIGWALVRDKEVAKKMVKFIEINTVGVSKEAQLRAATILRIVSDSCRRHTYPDMENFFEHSKKIMDGRWKRLTDVVKRSDLFSVTKYPIQHCNFMGCFTETHPAFAWMKCKEGVDGEKLFREQKIQTRSGRRFGSDEEYVRVSMVGRDHEFDIFVQRLSSVESCMGTK